MRIRVVGSTSRKYTDDATRIAEFKRWARPDTIVEVAQCEGGPESVECQRDVALVAANVMAEIIKAERQGVDGAIIACSADPGLFASREAVAIPVVGSGEAAMLAALTIGHRFAILTPLKNSEVMMRNNVRLYGLSDRLASVRSLDIPVVNLNKDDPRVREAVLRVAHSAVVDDGADCIILGCGRLTGLVEDMKDELPVPVLEPRGPAIHLAEMLVHFQVGHSRLFYPVPPDKVIM